MQMSFRHAVPTLLGLAAIAASFLLTERSLATATPSLQAATREDVTQRIEKFLANVGDTQNRDTLVASLVAGGPIEGLAPNVAKIGQLADIMIKEAGLPLGGASAVALADEKNVGEFLTARTYVVRGERAPMVWQFMIYNGAKGWCVQELGVSPNAHCVLPSWRDMQLIQQQAPRAAGSQAEPASAQK